MTREDEYRRRAEALLKLAAGADNMKERGRLIDEAMHWHNLALDLHDGELPQANDNDDADDAEAWA
ncbi:MAG: hypothetical protein JF588_03105 [Caulobacterales bacterium]|nr:hypothetical protein [Caulobacterales bacterium]